MKKLDITLYTMATKPVQFISSVEHNIGSFYGTTFCTYGKKPLALLHPQEVNSCNGAELSESSLASWAAPTWTETVPLARYDPCFIVFRCQKAATFAFEELCVSYGAVSAISALMHAI